MKALLTIIISVQLLLATSWALAHIPDTQHSKGVSYITGGVGEGESTAILAEAKQWPLLLELSQIQNGRCVWIFGASIKIMGSTKQVIFDAQAERPYMLVNLVPGDYTLEASYESVVQKRSISIKSDSSQTLSVFWK
ncbi:carboxypeptidase regulatory-like domain-containing protein [Polynucleobacter necessarius]|uniref:carboxypeptidase regulatory-like domain-containing protein n=1 Tax=Polynucleobacter necessarius TaxID=576610 RepID=UPI000E096C1E|nr:carboxypeptidase regulatory-like domain-containing protein [Polynucleobacter necessarius]